MDVGELHGRDLHTAGQQQWSLSVILLEVIELEKHGMTQVHKSFTNGITRGNAVLQGSIYEPLRKSPSLTAYIITTAVLNLAFIRWYKTYH